MKNILVFKLDTSRAKWKENTMPIYRAEKSKDYTIMSNAHLRDGRLSLKAKNSRHTWFRCFSKEGFEFETKYRAYQSDNRIK